MQYNWLESFDKWLNCPIQPTVVNLLQTCCRVLRVYQVGMDQMVKLRKQTLWIVTTNPFHVFRFNWTLKCDRVTMRTKKNLQRGIRRMEIGLRTILNMNLRLESTLIS